jgi:hypothetical protein
MKKIFPLLIVLVFSVASSGQTYNPLIESGKTWNVLTVTMADWFTSTYILDGDTLLDGYLWQKLYRKDYNGSLPEYAGGLREESSEKRVYFYDHNSTSGGLLYDFSLQRGDTVTIQSFNGFKGFELTLQVDTVDEVTDETGISRKRMLLSSYYSKNYGEEWIEGIGSMSGLISPGNFYYMADLNWESLCTKRDGATIFYNPLFDTCFISYVGIREVTPETPAIDVSPNPVTDVSILRLINFKCNSFWLDICDLTGRRVFRKFCPGNQYIINNQEFVPGVYFIKATGQDLGFASGKFLVR